MPTVMTEVLALNGDLVQYAPLAVWLPFLGSCIVAGAAFLGVFLSNRTNRTAIAAADGREYQRWHREALAELAFQMMETADESIGKARGCSTWTRSNHVAQSYEATNRITHMTSLFRRLEVLVGRSLDRPATKMVQAVSEVSAAACTSWTEVSAQGLNGTAQRRINELGEVATEEVREFADAVRRHLQSCGCMTSEPPGDAGKRLRRPRRRLISRDR